LGVGELQRLEWKRELIPQGGGGVVAAPAMPPGSLAEARAFEFHPVVADGVLLNDKELYLNATGPRGDAGFHVLTPLREPEGRIVFVNRGFVPTNLRAPASRATGQLAGTVHIRALLRLPPAKKPSWFIPVNRPA